MEAVKKIEDFFSSKKELDPKYVKKMKRIAMAYNIKLKDKRKKFCKKCFSDIRKAKSKINNAHKTTVCEKCGFKNRWKIGSS